jgi:glycosyltransferase involved in cell wall biosynthesis
MISCNDAAPDVRNKATRVKPLVSILIPAYNAEQWIAQTIEAAIAQTWPNREIIVVDDGSRDSTLQVARRFESGSVKITTQENAGACAARNKALSFAQGDYVQWLDADDLLAPDKISSQMRAVDETRDPLMLLTSAWGRFYFNASRARFTPDSLWSDRTPVEWMMRKFEDGVWMNPAAWLVSRQLTNAAGPWDLRLAVSGDDDGEYLCRIVGRSTSVKFVSDAKAYYRIGNVGGLSWRRSDLALESFFLATSLCIDHLRSLDDTLQTRQACVRFLQRRLPYFYPLNPTIVEAANSLARDLGGSLSTPETTLRFTLARRSLGWERAMKLKNTLSTAEMRCRRTIDKLLELVERAKAAAFSA